MKKFGSYLKSKNVYEFYEEPLFVQSEYYSLYFQKSIEELGGDIDVKNILVTSAQEVAYAQFSRLFKAKSKYEIEDRKSVIEDYFSSCGFGKINLKPIQAKGGSIEVPSDHYGLAWIRHFGERPAELPGVGYFTQGFLCGIMEAMFECRPGTFDGKQVKCISKGDEFSKFEIFRGFRRKISISPAMGKPQDAFETSVGYSSSLVDSIIDLNLSGRKDEKGLIHEFDQTLTLHYANYFALASIKLMMQANKKLGASGFKKTKTILTKISECNAYFMFGKIINSEFWQKYLKDHPDANANGNMHNCMDLLTAFGLGHWDVKESSSSQTIVDVHNCPETNAYLKLVGNSKVPIGFYNGGMLVGIANLLAKGPNAESGVDTEYVEKLIEGNQFEFVEEYSRMTGGDNDRLIVSQT